MLLFVLWTSLSAEAACLMHIVTVRANVDVVWCVWLFYRVDMSPLFSFHALIDHTLRRQGFGPVFISVHCRRRRMILFTIHNASLVSSVGPQAGRQGGDGRAMTNVSPRG